MVTKNAAQAFAVPRLQGFDHFFVIVQGPVPLRRLLVGQETQRLNAAVQGQVHLAQRRVACGQVDQVVDGAVALVIAGQIILILADHHGVVQRLDLLEFLGRDALTGQLAGERFDPAHQLEGLANFQFRHARDTRAAVGVDLDQAFDRQHLQRFAQWRAGDAQGFTKLAFVELLSRRQHAFGNEAAQVLDHRVVQSLALDLGH
ncbi:hypothetical protein D3C85_1345100 [compost metagenome]